MDVAVTEARRTLYAAHIREYGGALGTQKQLENLYDQSNGKDKEGFKADLRELVEVGRLLWDTLFQDQRERVRELRRTILADPAVIQIARAGHSTYVFPWALLYEIPMEPGDPDAWKFCSIIDKWNPQSDLSDKAQGICPHEADHTAMNTICPYGFWGIRHVIEQPPSTPRLVREVVTSTPPPQAILVTSKQLDQELMTHHLKEIALALSGFIMRPADSRSSMRSWLEVNAIELIYFYCHGLDTIAKKAPPQPYLGIGDKGRLMPGDLGAWFEGRWTDDHWSLTSPLVFINGCHTVSIIPGSLVQFVDAFAGVGAAGVVGTEITLHQRVASEVAEVFLKTLRQPGENIGSALRAMRLHMLRKGNVMGLAYTAYCSADLRFVDMP